MGFISYNTACYIFSAPYLASLLPLVE